MFIEETFSLVVVHGIEIPGIRPGSEIIQKGNISNQFISLYISAEAWRLQATVSGNVMFIWRCTGTTTTCSFLLVRVHILIIIIILGFKLQNKIGKIRKLEGVREYQPMAFWVEKYEKKEEKERKWKEKEKCEVNKRV
jgi:hypothetical protein